MTDPSNLSFSAQTDIILEQIQTSLEQHEKLEDLEIDLIDGVLKISLPDQSQIIINRQSAAKQIWLACSQGPAYFALDPQSQQWQDTKTKQSIKTSIAQILSNALKESIILD